MNVLKYYILNIIYYIFTNCQLVNKIESRYAKSFNFAYLLN
ncbi:hypothetical protein CTDIVETGP_0550 [Clostridium tyrobutyricum DIVETGP]|uniref:Uncharacterized protein n=1 Tax=Clostridium tyrobutyricum DIVETGP TaxID=1408889 RepID=W6N3J8_CLOTY|nr:hypothetical protein CTK_C15550 [Clostridium tyrobutyricum]CDL90480.1 hypothetical protein CTDIVETGP_0550 [Clostridium tyrobutyricum DIVETGP]